MGNDREDSRPRTAVPSERKRNWSPRRRQVVAGAATTLLGVVAGCGNLPGDGTPTGQEYDQLQRTAVYRDDSVDLSLPDDVPTVTAPTNADLIVLPGAPEADTEQAVEWLTDERVLALIGADSESTWLAWVQSDTFSDTFDTEGYGDAEPDPDLLVGATVGLDLARYNRTWQDAPRDRDILRALDEILVDLGGRTPQ